MSKVEFMECAICAAKPGSPTLCPGCLHNRSAITALQRRAEAAEAVVRDVRHASVTITEALRSFDKDRGK